MNGQEATAWQILANIAAGVFTFALVGGLTVTLVWSAATGRDLQFFGRLRGTDPRLFRRIVWTQRTNGITLSIAFFISLLAPFFPDVGLWSALLIWPFCGIWLWIILRWTVWAWRTALPPDAPAGG
jgi:hypothetical protein